MTTYLTPIDFIPNPAEEQIDLKDIKPDYRDTPGDYRKNRDEKWIKFCKDHKLSRNQISDRKWYDMYLDMCSLGLL